ncbi:MAG: PEP-CTERM system histidine kinase PrsK [Geobacteraceae bacterium]|nr:PEP-CTERM system histidine kinase PrsK [Geobacteraceae bacterium]
MTQALSITAIIAAVMFLLYFTLRSNTTAPPVALTIAIVASAVLELFDLMALYHPEQLFVWNILTLMAEAVLAPAWLWFAITYARKNRQHAIPLPLRLLLTVSPLIVILFLSLPNRSFSYSADILTGKVHFLGDCGFIFYILVLVYLVAALIQLEMTLSHTNLTSRWKIKFELLGAGGYLAILIIFYSHTLLFHALNSQLVPMRAIALITALAMMFYSRLKRGSGVNVYVSQQIACKSVVLLAVGMYIIFLGLAGEGMKYFGDGFYRAMIFSMVFFSGLGLSVILFSERVKRRVTIFIHKNFYQNKYDYRNQWLQFTERLSASQTSDHLIHSIVSEFCDTFGMRTGVLFIINQERTMYRQAAGIEMERDDASFSVNDPAIKLLASIRWIVDLRSNIAAPEIDRHSTLFSQTDACFIIPLFLNDAVDGFILLGRPHNQDEIYTHEDFDLMRTLANQAASALLNLRLSEQLFCSRELAAIGKVSTFVMHDLKNLVVTLSLLLENAQEHINAPDFQDDLLSSLGKTVVKMNTLIARLKDLPENSALQRTPVDLLQMAHDTAALANISKLEVTGTSVIAEVDREELQKVTLNLMLNAVEATDGSTPVRVEVGENGSPFIRVKDQGCGIPAAFMQSVLFKPFASTKKKGMGIGLYQSRQIIEAHGGRIEVVSTIDQGSEFTVWLPKIQVGAA